MPAPVLIRRWPSISDRFAAEIFVPAVDTGSNGFRKCLYTFLRKCSVEVNNWIPVAPASDINVFYFKNWLGHGCPVALRSADVLALCSVDSFDRRHVLAIAAGGKAISSPMNSG